MKFKNIFISFITVFLLLFADTAAALTNAPNSFNVNGSDAYVINGTKYLDGNGIITLNFKKAADGTIIYCTEIRKDTVTSGTKQYTLLNEIDARYAYVIQNGYPNKSITGDKDKDYFITAVTVWYLSEPNDSIFTKFDFSKGTYAGKENSVAKEIAKLLDGANKASYAEPSIKINGSTDSFILSSDKKYYVSSNLGVTTNGNVGDYTVNLDNAPSGTIIVDVNGNEKSTFGTSEKFIVKVPVSGVKSLSNEFKINVSANGNIEKAYLYGTDEAKYQKVAVLYPISSNVSNSISAKLNIITKVQISKIDITDGKELPGATLVIKNSKGEVVKTWVSSNEPEMIENLPAGKYILSETIAPDGYALSTEIIEFEVKLDGSVDKVTMENKPIEFKISKVDVTTGKELPGATLIIKNSKGEVVKTWVSSNEPEVIRGLTAGKYTLSETVAPEGYVLSTENIEFTVNEDGTVDKPIVMKNKPVEKNPIYISKKDFTTSEELAGAHLELKDSTGEIIYAWVSEKEPFMIEELKPGKYFLTEVLAPEGYELSTETVEFIVKEDGSVDGMIVMYNHVQTVEVPNTSSFKNITTSLIGIIVIGIGSMIIYKNYKKNEEY